MSWRKEQRRAERGYHHGNLKEALLQAALGLIAEKGAAGFTFADAARMAVQEAALTRRMHVQLGVGMQMMVAMLGRPPQHALLGRGLAGEGQQELERAAGGVRAV